MLTVSSMNFASASAVLYFVVMLSSSLENVIETLQDSGVLTQTAQRVFSLENYERKQQAYKRNELAYQNLSKTIADSDISSVAIIGASGAGKSVLLRDWFDYNNTQNCLLIEDYLFDDDGAIVAPDFTSLTKCIGAQQRTVIMLDETFKSVTDADGCSEREIIVRAIRCAKTRNNKLVVVLHAQTNCDVFDKVINFDEYYKNPKVL